MGPALRATLAPTGKFLGKGLRQGQKIMMSRRNDDDDDDGINRHTWEMILILPGVIQGTLRKGICRAVTSVAIERPCPTHRNERRGC
jgi:hypothetical protein